MISVWNVEVVMSSMFVIYVPERVSLLIVLLECLGQSWMIENPGGSSILLHPCLKWAIQTIQGAGGYVAFLKSELYHTLSIVLPYPPKMRKCTRLLL